MPTLLTTSINNDGIKTIGLQNGKLNTINSELVEQLFVALEEGCSGVLLKGNNAFFSAGLDLKEVLRLNAKELEHFVTRFFTLYQKMFAFNKPLCASIEGSSYAGGTVLSLTCDIRVLGKESIIGLNEMQVGMPVPEFLFKAYSQILGNNHAYKAILSGSMFSSSEAHQLGLVDVVAEENCDEQAISFLNKFLSYNQTAWMETKRNMRQSYLQYLKKELPIAIQQSVKALSSKSVKESIEKVLQR